ncbi:MAG: FAD-dependent monooxygenase [Propioniciclava sp.]
MNASLLPAHVDVLIVGAGPVGLTAAVALAGRDVSVALVDELPAARPESRALAIWPRTRDILAELDVILPEGAPAALPLEGVSYQFGASRAKPLSLRGGPSALIMPQPGLERALSTRATDLDVPIVRGARLLDLMQDSHGVTACISQPETVDSEIRCHYLIGAAGAGRTVRQLLNIAYFGKTVPAVFYLADCTLTGVPRSAVFTNYVTEQGYVAMCPLPDGRHRLFARLEHDNAPGEIDAAKILDRAGLSTARVAQTHWASTCEIHERVSEQFRDRRVFLAGDAAHVHSPAGGQGIQTGIGDVHNLTWKLTAALRGTASNALLDSYQAERMPVARAVIARSAAQARLWDTSTPVKRRRNRAAFTALNRLGLLRTKVLPAMLGYADTYPAPFGLRTWTKQRLPHSRATTTHTETMPLVSGLRFVLRGGWSVEEREEVARLIAEHPLFHPQTEQIATPTERGCRDIACVRPDGYLLFSLRTVNQLSRRLERICALWETPNRHEIGEV